MSVPEVVSTTENLEANWLQTAIFVRDVAQSVTARLGDWVVQIAELLAADAVAIVLNEPKRRRLRCIASTIPLTPSVKSGQAIVPPTRSLSAAVVGTGQVQQRTSRNRSLFEYLGVISADNAFGVPLLSGDERVGVLEVVRQRDGQNVQALAQTIASTLALAIVRERNQKALRRAKKEIAGFDQLKADFVGVASHELMSPLAVIIGHVSMVQEDVTGEPAKQLNYALKAAGHMRNLISDMLNLRYVDAGQTQLSLSRFDLAEFVKIEANDRRDVFNEKDQTLRVRVASEPLPVIGDPRMIEVILDVLLKNASKFTPEGGSVGVIVGEQNNKAWFAIADTGIGIPQDELEQIFGRFYQIEPHLRRKHGGLGLGLAIAKELVELHEGRIWAESALNKGSQFNVELPLVRDIGF